MRDDDLKDCFTRLARKYGGVNLVWGTANALGTASPDDFGVDPGRHVRISRAVDLALAMASCAGGYRRIREFLGNGELEFCTEIILEIDDGPQPLTGPVDVVRVHVEEGLVEHWVSSHHRRIAAFDTLEEALSFVQRSGLELDRVRGYTEGEDLTGRGEPRT